MGRAIVVRHVYWNWVRDARPPTLIRRECIDLIVA